jgi:hypothetical protein
MLIFPADFSCRGLAPERTCNYKVIMSLVSTRSLRLAWVALFLTACGGTTVPMTKPGASKADWERDKKACEAQAARAAKAQMGANTANQAHNRVLLSCMHDRGWTQPADPR